MTLGLAESGISLFFFGGSEGFKTKNIMSGTINLRLDEKVVDLTDQVHHLPCCIKHNGPTAVSHFFKPKSTCVEVEGLKVEEASFRGRKLQGATIPLPEGYKGFVVVKKNSSDRKSSDDTDINSNNWVTKAEFQNITRWNHDSLPSQDDACLRSFHLFPIAEALHKPVTVEDLASANITRGIN